MSDLNEKKKDTIIREISMLLIDVAKLQQEVIQNPYKRIDKRIEFMRQRLGFIADFI